MILSCAALALLTTWALPGSAIVTTQPLFNGVTNAGPYAVMGRIGIDLQRGNTALLVLSVSLAGRLRWDDHEWLLSGAHDRSTANSEQIGNKSFAHLRYRYWLNQHLQWELFGQLDQDRFRLMRVRALAGTGPRFVPYKSDLFEWEIGTAYFYEVEQMEASVDFPDGLTRKTHRANISSSARLDYKDLTLRQVIYMQPALSNLSNIRVLHEIDCAFQVLDHFSLTWTFTQSRDSIAPSDVVPFDNRLLAGVKADF